MPKAQAVAEALNLSRGDKVILTLKSVPFITVMDPGTGVPSQTMGNIPAEFIGTHEDLVIVDQDAPSGVMRRAWPIDEVFLGVLVANPLVAQ